MKPCKAIMTRVFFNVPLTFFLALLFVGNSFAQSVLERPADPEEYRSGFFAMDLRGIADTPYQNWFDPGNEFCRIRNRTNCDGTRASSAQADSALAVWESMSLCNKMRLRLFHLSEIKKSHASVEKVFVVYTTSIPSSLIAEARACLDAGTLQYIGLTFSQARTSIVNRTSEAFFLGFFPEDKMDLLIYGWENAAE